MILIDIPPIAVARNPPNIWYEIMNQSDESDARVISVLNPEIVTEVCSVSEEEDSRPFVDRKYHPLFFRLQITTWTLLHYAAAFDRVALVRPLVDMGADPNARDASGSAPIFLSVVSKNKDMALEMAAMGADPTKAIYIYDGYVRPHLSPLTLIHLIFCCVAAAREKDELGSGSLG